MWPSLGNALSGDVVGAGWYVSPLGYLDAPWILTCDRWPSVPTASPQPCTHPMLWEPQALAEWLPPAEAAPATALTVSPVPAVRLHDSISEEGFHYLVFDL